MIEAFDTGVRQHLISDPALVALVGEKVYQDLAPGDAAKPYVVISFMSSLDPENTPTDEVEISYNVKAVTDDASGGLQACARIASAVRKALNDTKPAIQGWGVYWCKETSGFRFVEQQDGRRIWYAGGIYRIGAIEAK